MILYFVIAASKCPCSFLELWYLLLLFPALSNLLLCAVKQLHDSSQEVLAYKIPVSLLTRQASQNVRWGCNVSLKKEPVKRLIFLQLAGCLN